MEIKKLTLVILLSLGFNQVIAQQYLDGDRFKVGLKAGPVLSIITGDAFAKASVKNGFTGGLYYRYKLKGGFHYQTELNAMVRGARFKNTGPDGYTKVNLMYLDATQLILKDLKKNDHTHCAVLGIQPSLLLQSWVYNPYWQLSPAARGIALNGGDLYAVFGYQLNKQVIGIQSVVKIGLTNVNRGLNMHDVSEPPKPILPATNNSGLVRNISWEVTLSF
jgi:hypothetical protein